MADPGVSAPTGCYKCGRPGHWSRDCPSFSSTEANPNSNTSSIPNPAASKFTNNANLKEGRSSYQFLAKSIGKAKTAEKPKRLPRSRPKLTPELLLSEQGLGYILQYFPPNFKYRGRGHEVSDLRNLLLHYSDWHSQLLPYYPLDQFIQKVELVGSTKRVKICLKELRERVANGGNPTKLNESPHEPESLFTEEPISSGEATAEKTKSSSPPIDCNELEDILNHEYRQTVGESSQVFDSNLAAGVTSFPQTPDQGEQDGAPNVSATSASGMQISEHQKARMEANRLKALERAAERRLTVPNPNC